MAGHAKKCVERYCELANKTTQQLYKVSTPTPILQGILRNQNPLLGEHCAFLEVIYLFQQVGCARNKLQFRTVQQNQKSFLLMQDWHWTGFPALDLCDLMFQFLEARLRNMIERGDPLWTNVKVVLHLTRFTNASSLKEWSMIWITLTLFTQTSNLLIRKLCCLCLKTTKQWSRRSWREKARHWDMFPEPTELLLIGYSIESIGTPKIQIKYNDTKNQLADILTKRNGIIFCVCLKSAISVLQSVLKWCRKERKKIQVKKASQQSRSRWWIWSRDAAKGLLSCLPLPHQKDRWKPDTKVNLLWARKLSSILERWDPLYTHSTRTDSVLKMIRWSVTPKQNQKCR